MTTKPIVATNEPPAWLKAMQNGSIGEARARAFLLDRFWVLERSVDIDGADLIIQRRITTKNLLDREAPRLGVVQVKFFGGPATPHYVHRQYVLDSEGNPRTEFFVLCYAGGEDDPKAFLLTAEDIKSHFDLTEHNGAEKFHLPYSGVDTVGRFAITRPNLALDRIEHRLQLADFTANRRFMSWLLPSASGAIDAILPEFREPIDNNWGSIPEGFKHIKKSASQAMIDVEEIYELLRAVVDETDPLKAAQVIGKIRYHCRAGHGRWSISLPDDLDDQDFVLVCRRHKAMVDKLKNDGRLDAFIGLRIALKRAVMKFLEPHFPVAKDLVHRFTVTFDPESLSVAAIRSELIGRSAAADQFDKDGWIRHVATASAPGVIHVQWQPGRHGFTMPDEEPSLARFRDYDFSVYNECMEFVYTQKYGEPVLPAAAVKA